MILTKKVVAKIPRLWGYKFPMGWYNDRDSNGFGGLSLTTNLKIDLHPNGFSKLDN